MIDEPAHTETEVEQTSLPTGLWAILWLVAFGISVMGFLAAAELAAEYEMAWPLKGPTAVLILAASLATGVVATVAKMRREVVREDG